MTQDSNIEEQEKPPRVIYLLWWDEVGLASPLDATWSKVRLNPGDIKYEIADVGDYG